MTTPNPKYASLASAAQIQRTVEALAARGMIAIVVETGADARKKVAELLPAGAEAFISSSATLDQLGITEDVDKSGRYDSVRVKLSNLNYQTRQREMVKLGASPEYVLGSVHALTESGVAMIASASGSQLGPFGAGASKVIWVVGSQKIVPNYEEGVKHINEYALPLEDERALKVYKAHSVVGKL